MHAKLKEIFGFDNFKGDQEAIINSILSGKDTFVIMPTGGGKSLCYQLPAMISQGTAIVVSPLIALMKHQVDAVRYTSGQDCVAHFLNSSLSKAQTKEVKDDLLQGGTKLLYVAPETLSKEDTIEFLQQIDISFFAIDEAHCISEWGHDFRPEYRRLRDAIDHINKQAPILTLTASATPKVQQDIIKNLRMEHARLFVSSFNRPNLYYEVRPKPSQSINPFLYSRAAGISNEYKRAFRANGKIHRPNYLPGMHETESAAFLRKILTGDNHPFPANKRKSRHNRIPRDIRSITRTEVSNESADFLKASGINKHADSFMKRHSALLVLLHCARSNGLIQRLPDIIYLNRHRNIRLLIIFQQFLYEMPVVKQGIHGKAQMQTHYYISEKIGHITLNEPFL